MKISTRSGYPKKTSRPSATHAAIVVGRLPSQIRGALGSIVVRPGDGRGARGLATIGDKPVLFQAAGSLGQVSMSISRYAAEFGGAIGRGAAAAETRKASADAVATEANNRRQAVEGVNLDEELINLTTYQQAYNASARMIQAASELLDTLLSII